MVRSPDHRRSRSWGWVLITVGICCSRSHRLDPRQLWHLLLPGLLLFVGGTLVWRAIHGPPKPQAISGADDHVEFVRSFALMSGCELRPVSRPFRGADLTA
jgi:hypothetical protein